MLVSGKARNIDAKRQNPPIRDQKGYPRGIPFALVKPWLDHLAHKCANVVLPLAVMWAIITLEVRIESNCCSLGKIPLRGMRFLDAVRHPRFLTKTDLVGINTFSIFRRRAVLVL